VIGVVVIGIEIGIVVDCTHCRIVVGYENEIENVNEDGFGDRGGHEKWSEIDDCFESGL